MTALLPCPLCGEQDGYTLIGDSDCRRWGVMCSSCGAVLSDCPRTYQDGEEETRSDHADTAWNDAGAYAQSLRDATALAVAAERERCIQATKRPEGWWNAEQLRVSEEIRAAIKAGGT